MGQGLGSSCKCPCRLAAGTVVFLIGKLRAIFISAGMGGVWDDNLGTGNHTFGKTLRGDALNTFSIRCCENLDICPLYNFERYMSISKLLKVDLRSGFLFRSTKGSSVTAEPFVGSAIYNRLKFYLGVLGLDSGETPHSLRAGCSITLSLLGFPKGQF